MRAQLIPTVFIILLVAGVITGYVFYNIFYGAKYQSQVFDIHTIDSVRNLIENFKNYLQLSLTYSSHQALREHACESGTIGASAWIVNGPNPVEVEESKECLSAYTKYYFDTYFDFYNTSLPVELYGEHSPACIYDVDNSKVFSGDYDEGYFWVNCSGAKIMVSGKNIKEFEEVEIDDFITKNRYWYMFRNFYEWAMADVYSPCICSIIGCSCGSKSGEEFCTSCSVPVENCAEKALKDLERRFADDETIICKKEKLCCKQGIGPLCLYPCGCQGWQNMCMAKNAHDCVDPSIGEKPCPVADRQKTYLSSIDISSNGQSSEYLNGFDSTILSDSLSLDGICRCHYEGRVSGGYRYTCQDFKYLVPSDKGPVPLIFEVNAYAFWRDPCACCTICPCPGCGC